MTNFNLFIFVESCVLALPLVCRLAFFDKRLHQWKVAIMHVVMAFSTANAGYQSWEGAGNVGHLFALCGVGMWIVISYGHWSDGVPPEFMKGRKTALDKFAWSMASLGLVVMIFDMVRNWST